MQCANNTSQNGVNTTTFLHFLFLILGRVDLLSHFSKCKNQKFQFQNLQESAFLRTITNTLRKKIFVPISFLHHF